VPKPFGDFLVLKPVLTFGLAAQVSDHYLTVCTEHTCSTFIIPTDGCRRFLLILASGFFRRSPVPTTTRRCSCLLVISFLQQIAKFPSNISDRMAMFPVTSATCLIVTFVHDF
jgi:hypothetical protein